MQRFLERAGLAAEERARLGVPVEEQDAEGFWRGHLGEEKLPGGRAAGSCEDSGREFGETWWQRMGLEEHSTLKFVCWEENNLRNRCTAAIAEIEVN